MFSNAPNKIVRKIFGELCVFIFCDGWACTRSLLLKQGFLQYQTVLKLHDVRVSYNFFGENV